MKQIKLDDIYSISHTSVHWVARVSIFFVQICLFNNKLVVICELSTIKKKSALICCRLQNCGTQLKQILTHSTN